MLINTQQNNVIYSENGEKKHLKKQFNKNVLNNTYVNSYVDVGVYFDFQGKLLI
jgi:uncharacterized protein YxeA